jgi:hypothetical protein
VFDEIKLTNVDLNISNINKMLHNMPIQIISGKIGALILSAPLASFWNNPSYLTLKDVNIEFVVKNTTQTIEFDKVAIIK